RPCVWIGFATAFAHPTRYAPSRRMRRPWTALRHIHHLLNEPLRELVPDGGARRLVPEIMQLVRISLEVVELAPGHVAIDADAPAVIDKRAHGELGRQRLHRPL